MTRSIVQSSALALCTLNPVFRRTRDWMDQVWDSDQGHYEGLVLQRLNMALATFVQKQLLKLPAGVALPLTSLGQLAEFPSMTREVLRDLFPKLQALYSGKRGYALYRTGGTTGRPTQLYRLKSNSAIELASATQMIDIVGWRPGMLRIALWGSQRDLNLGVGPGWSIRRSINRELQHIRFFDSYKSDETIYLKFIGCVLSNPGCAIYGYPTMLAECVRLMRQKAIALPVGQVAAIWTTSEALQPGLAAEIEEGFRIRPRDFYGSRECPSISAECGHGRRHINPRYIVEVLAEETDEALPEGQAGELAITDVLNSLTPLVRYRIGDRGRVSRQACACGRQGPVLDAFEGRVADSYVLKSGERRTAIWFTDIVRYPEVSSAQLVRTGLDSFEVRYTGSQLPEASISRMKEVAGYMLEGADIGIRLVDHLTRSPEGKHLVFVDEFSPEPQAARPI